MPFTNRSKIGIQLASFLVLLFVGPGQVLGQSTAGRISGTIADTAGAVVAGVTVTITNEATQISRSAATDENGFYLSPTCPPVFIRSPLNGSALRKSPEVKTRWSQMAA